MAHGFSGAADNQDIHFTVRWCHQLDLTDPGSLHSVCGESRPWEVQPGGRLCLVTDDEMERVGVSVRCREFSTQLLSVAPKYRGQAADVSPAEDHAPPENCEDGQDQHGDDADTNPHVTREKARRLRRLAAIWLAGQGRRWAAVRIDVIGVRIGRRRTPEIAHLQGIG